MRSTNVSIRRINASGNESIAIPARDEARLVTLASIDLASTSVASSVCDTKASVVLAKSPSA